MLGLCGRSAAINCVRKAGERLPTEVEMPRAPKISRAQAIALPRPAPAVISEWVVAGIAVALLLAGLLGA